jgi:hypothetical protein
MSNFVSRARSQRGVSLIGLIFWAAILGFFLVLAMRIVPTVSEFSSIKRMVDRVARDGGSTPVEIRQAYEKHRLIESGVDSVTGDQLEITKVNDQIVVSFSYDEEIPLFGPAYILIKYRGSSSASR